MQEYKNGYDPGNNQGPYQPYDMPPVSHGHDSEAKKLSGIIGIVLLVIFILVLLGIAVILAMKITGSEKTVDGSRHNAETVRTRAEREGKIIREDARIDEEDIFDDSEADSIVTTEVTSANEGAETSAETEAETETVSEEKQEVKTLLADYSVCANSSNGGQAVYDGEKYFLGGLPLICDDNNTQKVLLEKRCYYLNCNDEYLFFVTSDNDHIFRMKKDGSELTKLYDHTSHELILYNDMLYFCSDMGTSSYHICCMDTNGSNVKVLYDCNEWFMNVYKDRIYFTDYDSDRKLMSMALDGSDVRTLYDSPCYDVCAVNDKLYFSLDNDSRNLFSFDIASGEVSLIRKKYTRYTNYYNGRLYFVDEDGNISSCLENGDDVKTEYTSKAFSYLTFLPERAFYCDSDDNYNLVELK